LPAALTPAARRSAPPTTATSDLDGLTDAREALDRPAILLAVQCVEPCRQLATRLGDAGVELATGNRHVDRRLEARHPALVIAWR
jgi:hypothetical protein